MLKYLVTRGLVPPHPAGHEQGGERWACCRASFHSYRPFIEALENRNVLSFLPPVSYATGDSPISVAVGDFNGDGIPDLAVANVGTYPNYADSTVSVLLGNGDGSFQTARNYAAPSGSLAVADFNGDGKLDLVTSGGSLLLGQGDGTFQRAQSCPSGPNPWTVAVGDFNGDGIPDLACIFADSMPRVFLGNGDGTFQAAQSSGSGFYWMDFVVAGDFNGDGRLDLAVTGGQNTGEWVFFWATATAPFKRPKSTTSPSAYLPWQWGILTVTATSTLPRPATTAET